MEATSKGKPAGKNVNALMDEPMYEQLRQAAFTRRVSMSEIIRDALTLWFEQQRENDTS